VSEWLRLLAAVRTLHESLETVVAPFGLMLREYELLRCLPGRALTQTAIVRQLETNKVSVSRGVRRLSCQGWLKVTPCPGDKRASTVVLTEQGADNLAAVEDHVAQFLAALAAALGAEERRMLAAINEALRRFLAAGTRRCAMEQE
jgi:DNA-binding MarR family transcriptional regulator